MLGGLRGAWPLLPALLLASLLTGIGETRPALTLGLGAASLLVLVAAAHARALRVPFRPLEAALALSGFTALFAAVVLGGHAGPVLFQAFPDCGPRAVRALALVSALAFLLLAALPAIERRLDGLEGRGVEPAGSPPSHGTALVLALGVAFHAYVLLSLPPLISGDTSTYFNQPALLEPTWNMRPPHFPPVYPGVLHVAISIFGQDGLLAVVLLQHALVLTIALVVDGALRRYAESPLVAAGAGLALALDGNLALYAQAIQSETLAVALSFFAAILLLRAASAPGPKLHLVGAGLLAALAALTRQAAEGWFAAGAAWLFLLRPIAPVRRAVALFLALSLLPLALVALHHYVIFGRFTLTASTGRNLVYRAVWDMPPLTDPLASPEDPLERARRITWEHRQGAWLEPYDEIQKQLGWKDAEIHAAFSRFYFEQATRYPAAFTSVTARNAWALLRSSETCENLVDSHELVGPKQETPPWRRFSRTHGVPPLLALANALALSSSLAVILLAFLGPVLATRPARPLALLSLASVGYYVTITVLVEWPLPRYHLPLIPFLVLSAGAGVAGLAERIRGKP